jgi:uncharacterized cofD-like protein
MRTDALSHVVSLGGGTGLSSLLKGLKHFVSEQATTESPVIRPWIARLTAVVTVTDDGGSSGRLREELQVLPPGDIRNCMVALSTDESLLSKLFQYRFRGRGELRGHSFGNLFLTALTSVTGDFIKAIRVSSDVLSIRGRIFPSTLQDVQLVAHLEGGGTVVGETAIAGSRRKIKCICLRPRTVRPVPDALEAIRSADVISIGPGSLFTSLVPNLLVSGVVEAIRSSSAFKVYIGNLMTQPGETDAMMASDHLEVIHRHAGGPLFDAVIVNRKPIARRVCERYERQGAVPVRNDLDRIRGMGLSVFEFNLLAPGREVRHEPILVASAIRDAHRYWSAARARRPSHFGGR